MLAWLRALILATTILGGLHGCVITLHLVFSKNSQGMGVLALSGCMFAAYAYVTATGIIVWRHPNQLRPMLWAQAIQIPSISLPGLVYKFAAGLSGAVCFVLYHTGDKYGAGLSTHWNLGSSCEVRFFQNAPIELGINIVALAVLLILRTEYCLRMSPSESPRIPAVS
jgi:hypothetical protein